MNYGVFGGREVFYESVEAERRIRPYIRETPAEYSQYLSNMGRCNVYLKLENMQLSGSFKLRGAFNKLLTLNKNEKEAGIITASSGNHAAAVTLAMGNLGVKGTIFVPEIIAKVKLEVLELYKADLTYHGTDMGVTESYARKFAIENGRLFISPYNDARIIGGQGTIGIELESQIKKIDAVFVPVGGGGLMAGISGYLKSVNPDIEIIGCQPENSCVMYESIKAGKIVDIESGPTLADGTAGGIEPGSLTFNICKDCVDDFVILTENEISKAIKLVLQKFYMVIEGAAALSVAAFMKVKKNYAGKNVILIISGKKISIDTLSKIICSPENL